MREGGYAQTARLFRDIAARHSIPPKMAAAFGAYAAYHDQARASEEAYELALNAAPSADTLLCRGLSRLRQGNWREGWIDMENRLDALRLTPFSQLRGKSSGRSVERWRVGEPLPSDLLVFPEQGLGDTLQFARFLPDLVRRGVEVTVVGRAYLEPAIRSLSPAPRFHRIDEPLISRAERWCCLMSLPALLGLERSSDLARSAYLFQDVIGSRPARAESGRLAVGFAWQGNPDHPRDAHRSTRLSALAPLLRAPGVQPVSLQIGPGASQIAETPEAERMLTPLGDDASLVDTAKVIADLDLVISVDTAVAHLAGAMGRRTILLLAAAGVDWRWRRNQRRTPWYENMTVAQQSRAGRWADPVSEALAQVADMGARA